MAYQDFQETMVNAEQMVYQDQMEKREDGASKVCQVTKDYQVYHHSTYLGKERLEIKECPVSLVSRDDQEKSVNILEYSLTHCPC